MIHVSLRSRVPKSSHMSDIPADTCILKAVMSFDFTPQIGQCAYYSHTELGMCECVAASRVMEMHMSVVTCSAINLRRLSKYKLLARQKRMICSVSAGNKLKKQCELPTGSDWLTSTDLLLVLLVNQHGDSG